MRAKILARGGAVAAALSLCSGLLILASTSASAAPACTVDYRINQWDTGFTADVTLKNLGNAISEGWTLEWDFAGNQKVTNGWSATYTQSGQHVSAKNPEWTPGLPTGESASLGFNASYSGSNTAPTSFTLNGTVCNGSPTTTTTTTTTTTGTTTTTTTGNSGEHVANPYSGPRAT